MVMILEGKWYDPKSHTGQFIDPLVQELQGAGYVFEGARRVTKLVDGMRTSGVEAVLMKLPPHPASVVYQMLRPQKWEQVRVYAGGRQDTPNVLTTHLEVCYNPVYGLSFSAIDAPRITVGISGTGKKWVGKGAVVLNSQPTQQPPMDAINLDAILKGIGVK